MTQKVKVLVALAVLVISGLFLFVRLGHYALWDDEAGTALSALGVWRTGDTTAILDHNIAAYESGKDLHHLRERFMPPLQAYLTAPFVGIMGRNALAARLPFALCAAICVGLMFWWLMRKGDLNLLIFFGLALLTNVSFFLYARQCRYYALSMLFSVVLAYLYLNWDGSRKRLIWFVVVSILFFASNYLNYVAFYVCLAVDYLLWGRARYRLSKSDLLLLVLPQLLVCGGIFSIWNPLARWSVVEPYPEVNRLEFIWWCIRDVSRCEFGAWPLALLALVLYVVGGRKNLWLLRAVIGLLIFVLMTALLVPHPPSLRGVAGVRYFTPAIPLFALISALVLSELWSRVRWVTFAVAVVAFSSNLLNGGPLFEEGLRSTTVCYIRELLQPPPEPFSPTAQWIEENLREKESVWVMPDYAAYPLMYMAPKPLYAWQLTWPPRDDFKSLPQIHFIGRVPPEYIIGFGPAVDIAKASIGSWNRPDLQYRQVAVLDYYWRDQYRPELFWRSFSAETNYDRNKDAIYIFKLEQLKK